MIKILSWYWYPNFHDTLNVVVILAPGSELSSVKCTQFTLTFYRMKLNKVHFFFRSVITHFWDKHYQEINYKSHLNNAMICK